MSIIEKAIEKLQQQNLVRGNRSSTQAPILTTVPSKSLMVDESMLFDLQLDQIEELNTDDETKDSRNKCVKTSSVIEVDLPQLKKMGILTADNPNKSLAEEIRRIKRPLLISAFDENLPSCKNRNLIMVTSALLGEGKTFIALNLAMSIAMEIDRTVLLVDADVTRQSLAKRMGITGRPGLSNFLADEDGQDLANFLLKTNIPKLTFLPAGCTNDHITELWASEKMCALMDELSQRYHDRVIIFDSPPLLIETSGSVLAKSVGQVVMVVEAEKTSHHVILEALQTIEDCENIGLVLNKSNRKYSTDYSSYYEQ